MELPELASLTTPERILRLYNALTMGKVLAVFFVFLLLIAGQTVYENKDALLGTKVQLAGNQVGYAFKVSDLSKTLLSDLVVGDPSILAIAVWSGDLRLNQRQLVYAYTTLTSDVTLPSAPFRLLPRVPIFSSNESSNRQAVRLLNGEFVCEPYRGTIFDKLLPGSNSSTVAFCSTSLPPYYGYYSGQLTAFLTVDPSLEYQLRLKIELERIANQVYFKDVLATSKKAIVTR